MNKERNDTLQPARFTYESHRFLHPRSPWIYRPSLRLAFIGARAVAGVLVELGHPVGVIVECLETGRVWEVSSDGATLIEQSENVGELSTETSPTAIAWSVLDGSARVLEPIEVESADPLGANRASRLASATKVLGRLAETARDRRGRICGRTSIGSRNSDDTKILRKVFPEFALAEIVGASVKAKTIGNVVIRSRCYIVLSITAAEAKRVADNARKDIGRAALKAAINRASLKTDDDRRRRI